MNKIHVKQASLMSCESFDIKLVSPNRMATIMPLYLGHSLNKVVPNNTTSYVAITHAIIFRPQIGWQQ